MFVFALLLVFYALTRLFGFLGWKTWSAPADARGWALGLTLLITGSTHFVTPEPYLAMMPAWLPWPQALVYISGAAEIIIGLGLCSRRWRRPAALLAIALFLAVFPANIHAAVSGVEIPNYPSSPTYRWARLPMQLLLIGWAYWTWRTTHRERKAR